VVGIRGRGRIWARFFGFLDPHHDATEIFYEVRVRVLSDEVSWQGRSSNGGMLELKVQRAYGEMDGKDSAMEI
jgi:hypothetical protein